MGSSVVKTTVTGELSFFFLSFVNWMFTIKFPGPVIFCEGFFAQSVLQKKTWKTMLKIVNITHILDWKEKNLAILCKKSCLTQIWVSLSIVKKKLLGPLNSNSLNPRSSESQGFQWCGFHLCAFPKNSLNIHLVWYFTTVVKEFLHRCFLFTNDMTHGDLAYANFCQC